MNRSLAYILSTVTLLAMTAALPADTIKVGAPGSPGIKYDNIRVTGIRDGQIYFFTTAGEQSTSIENIQSLTLSKYPDYEKADALLNDKKYKEASGVLDQLAGKVEEDWLKTLVMAKLVFAMDRSGQFDKAINRYLQLIRLDTSEFVVNLIPQNLPREPEARAAAARDLERELQFIAEPQIIDLIKKVIEALKAEPDKAMPIVTPGGGGGLVGGEAEGQRDFVAEALDAGNFDKALNLIDEQLKDPRATLSKLLYQRGMALAGKNENRDAAVAFMRVVIFFRPNTTAYYTPSLIEAGKVFAKLDNAEHAKAVWTEAKDLVQDDPEKSKQVEQLLAGLK